jgi:hypothetical protein
MSTYELIYKTMNSGNHLLKDVGKLGEPFESGKVQPESHRF